MDTTNLNVVIHYQRKNADYTNWSLWLWEFPQKMGKQFEFNGEDDYGITATYPLTNWSNKVVFNNLGMIIKATDSWYKDGGDKIIKFYKMETDKDGNYHVYVKQGDDDLYANDKFERISPFNYAKFLDWNTLVSIRNRVPRLF